MLAWVHLLTQELSSAGSGSGSAGASSSEGVDGPISTALRNSLATVKVSVALIFW